MDIDIDIDRYWPTLPLQVCSLTYLSKIILPAEQVILSELQILGLYEMYKTESCLIFAYLGQCLLTVSRF